MNLFCIVYGIVEFENELYICFGFLDEFDLKKRDKVRDKILEEWWWLCSWYYIVVKKCSEIGDEEDIREL